MEKMKTTSRRLHLMPECYHFLESHLHWIHCCLWRQKWHARSHASLPEQIIHPMLAVRSVVPCTVDCNHGATDQTTLRMNADKSNEITERLSETKFNANLPKTPLRQFIGPAVLTLPCLIFDCSMWQGGTNSWELFQIITWKHDEKKKRLSNIATNFRFICW